MSSSLSRALLDRCRKLMEMWGRFCCTPVMGAVVPLRRKAAADE
jgi:hypothetical protein